MRMLPRTRVRLLVTSRIFELFIMAVIVVNGVFIGLETYYSDPLFKLCNQIFLWIYTCELLLRFYARRSLKSYLHDGWNILDLIIVITGWIPEDLFADAAFMALMRVLRVFRLVKIFRTNAEMRIMISVMVQSTRTLCYNLVMMLIFIYIFAVAGCYLFKLPAAGQLPAQMQTQYTQYVKDTGIDGHVRHDPYGTLDEAMFTLMRSMTGDAWTDVRYNLIYASELGLIKASPVVITLYHVCWFIFGAFLLINVLMGAVINNYEGAMAREESKLNKEHASRASTLQRLMQRRRRVREQLQHIDRIKERTEEIKAEAADR